jgi:biotin-dependent carboxylase-like uncharacterized protein
MIEVRQAGLCDLVMDRGRPGWGALGVPAGGAADLAAFEAGNRLVGNDVAAAGLEIVQRGPLLCFPHGAVVALTGAAFAARRSSGVAVAWNETLVLAAGETLQVEGAREGCRCWLAVRGGIEVPSLLGSRSTFLPGGFGGHAGRALRAGDRLAPGRATSGMRLLRAQPATGDETAPLRVVAGPQAGLFDDAGLAAFFGGSFRVDPASDRRGVRLAGPAVTPGRVEVASQGVLPGAIQVPPDGRPIILGWDGPVTGGYPVIATVIGADRARLAQLRPGDTVRFVTVAVDIARALAANAEWDIAEIG